MSIFSLPVVLGAISAGGKVAAAVNAAAAFNDPKPVPGKGAIAKAVAGGAVAGGAMAGAAALGPIAGGAAAGAAALGPIAGGAVAGAAVLGPIGVVAAALIGGAAAKLAKDRMDADQDRHWHDADEDDPPVRAAAPRPGGQAKQALSQMEILASFVERTVLLGELVAIYEDNDIAPRQGVPAFSLQPGDVVVTGLAANPAFALVESADAALPPPGSLVLRMKEPHEGVDAEYLCSLLSIQDEAKLVLAFAAGTDELKSFCIPVLSKHILAEFVSSWRIEKKLLEQYGEIRATRLKLLAAKDPDDYQEKLREINAAFHSAFASMKQASDLSFQLQNIYPFPLAFSYRNLSSCHNDFQLYQEQMRVGENILSFLAVTGLALLRPEERSLVKHIDGRSLKDVLQRGISPGNWKSLIEISRAALEKRPGSGLGLAFLSLGQKGRKGKEFRDRLKMITQWKNDFKHDRGPKAEAELAEATKEMDGCLRAVLAELSFFTRFRIHFVRDCNLKSRRGSDVKLTVESLVGDHPSWPTSVLDYGKALMKEDLFIETGNEWASLHPFMKVKYCPTCKSREVFFIDKWGGPGEPASLKSFEKGHELKDGDIAAGLKEWLDGGESAPIRIMRPRW